MAKANSVSSSSCSGCPLKPLSTNRGVTLHGGVPAGCEAAFGNTQSPAAPEPGAELTTNTLPLASTEMPSGAVGPGPHAVLQTIVAASGGGGVAPA